MAESLCWNKSFLVITSPVYVIFQTFRVLTVRKISEQNLMLTFGKSVRIQSYFGLHFPAFGLNMERYGVSLHIQSKCGKIRTRITPNTDNFQAVLIKFHIDSTKHSWVYENPVCVKVTEKLKRWKFYAAK